MAQNDHSTLISVRELVSRLDDTDLTVIDCRFDLKNPDKGAEFYSAGHIPGAVYAHLDNDLAAPVTADTGRHPMPAPTDFEQTLRRLGVHRHSQVVAYDDAGGGLAARLWWMLRWMGHQRVAVLDGGYAAWQAAGLPVSEEPVAVTPGDFAGEPDHSRVITTAEVIDALAADSAFALVDARDARRFRGEIEPIDPVAGHIPGALNLPFDQNLGDGGRWRGRESVARAWQSLDGFDAGAPWAVMCGSGVTACHLALAAEIAGLAPPRLYAGSWSEWIRDPARPVGTTRGG